jgi:DNA-binding XRE family transcriptional regulator
MANPQIIRTETGEELVVLTRRDYEALRARAGDEAAEDVMSARIVAESDAALAKGADVALPDSVWAEIEGGANPLRVLRRMRGMTQDELAAAAGLSQSYLSDIEAGRKRGTADTLKSLARELRVPLDLLA